MWVCIGPTGLNKMHQILSSIQKLSDKGKLNPNESNNFHSNNSQDITKMFKQDISICIRSFFFISKSFQKHH